MSDPIIIEPYNPKWPDLFLQYAKPIRDILGDIALRIDHIGSTSIPNLQSKPVIDIQISIPDFSLISVIEPKMKQIGYNYQKDNDDKSHLYFREMDGSRNVHIHIRKAGSFGESFHLLFRDYLRIHEKDRNLYEQTKINLSKQFKNEREKYTNGKSDVIWDIMRRAYSWNQEIGWDLTSSDM